MGNGYGVYALGDDNLITNSGTAKGSFGYGIYAVGENNTIANSGIAAGGLFGIQANGDDNVITNSGSATGGDIGITAEGTGNNITNLGMATGSQAGIYAIGTGIRIANSGTVTSPDVGIKTIGDDNIITNSGMVMGAALGIWAVGNNNTITNSGKAESGGITAQGSNNTITNSGMSALIATFGENNTITNSGTVAGSKYAITTFGENNTITNSGKIAGKIAVRFNGSGNTLTLLAGSNVEGSLDLAGHGGNSLVIGRRLNTALTFTGGIGVSLETNGLPFVVHHADLEDVDVLAVVDPTVYAAEDDMLGDLTRSLADVVDGRLGFVTGHSANNVRVSTSNAEASGSQWATWATGIGNYRSQTADGIYDGFDTTLGGFALGTDGVLSSGTTFGGFVGASRAHVNTNAGNEQIDTGSTYAGLYAGYSLPNAFVNLAVTGGYANTDTSRDVLNNMVVGGIEQAKGNPDGVFFAPQATIGTEIKNARGIVTPSLRIAYTRLTMGSYDETGSAADMSVGSRTVNVVDLRGQVAFAIKPIIISTGPFDATMRLGANATFTNSDDITATLLGQPITFSTSSQDTTLRGFAGVDLVHAMDNGADLKLSVEAGYDTGHAVTLKGTAGVTWAF
jgi:hypothetical protein